LRGCSFIHVYSRTGILVPGPGSTIIGRSFFDLLTMILLHGRLRHTVHDASEFLFCLAHSCIGWNIALMLSLSIERILCVMADFLRYLALLFGQFLLSLTYAAP
jgi:hypothetical protein